jgi:hypothetical protein
VEPLELRRLLCSTHLAYLPPAPEWSDAIEQESRQTRAAEGGPEAIDIVWTNRGQASDNFALAFGTSAEAGRQVVDAAIAAWERVITSFNRSDGTNTLQITISIATDAMGNLVGGFGGAGGPAASAPADGKPRTGSITLNAGSIVAGTPNDSNGWFFDSTPNDYSEFNGGILNPFSGNPGSSIGGEFYSVAVAEMTHVLGFISPKAGGAGSNWVGYELIDSGFTQATGQRDNAEGGGTSGYYYVFNGPSVSHAMTGYNSGDPDDDSWGNVIHTAGGTANFTHNAVNYRGTDDDGNAAGGGERTLPSWVTANILKDAYGYTIENPAKFGTMMAILNQSTGALTVRGINNSDDTIFITSTGGTTTVHVDLGTDFPGSGFRPGAGNLSAWVSEFPTGSITSINIDAGSGDDVVNLDLPGNIPITVSGGAGGNDLLLIKGSTGYDNVNVDFPIITSTALNVQSFSEFEQLRIDTRTGNADLYLTDLLGSMTGVTVQGDSGNETINLHTLEASKPAVFFMGSGNDTVNVQVDFGVGLVASPVTINGFDGDDVVNIGPVDFAGTIVTQPITFNGDNQNDTLIIGSNNADSLAANVVFNGGSNIGGLNDRLIINDQAPSYSLDYDVATTFVRRTGLSTRDFGYTGTEEIIINAGNGADSVIVRNAVSPIVRAFGNGGNDNFTRGDGLLSASSGAQFDGGPGVDQITFDDRNNPGNIIFDCREGEVIYGGIIIQQTTGFESVGVLAGTGSNEITFAGTIFQNFNVDAGPGNDPIILGFTGSGPGSVDFRGNVLVNGGDGSDTFTVNSVNTGAGASVTLNGGNNLNTLNVVRPGTLQYDLANNFVNLYSFGSSGLLTVSNFETTSISGNSLSETFNLFSGSSLFSTYTIFANNGDDVINCIAGDHTFNLFDNLVVNGGAGVDSFRYNAAGSTLPRNYTLANGVLSIPVGGIFFDDITIGSAVENITISGGSGDDTFAINQLSSGAAVLVNGGEGSDVVNLGNGNMQLNLTNAAAFTVDGQGGADTLNINNASNAGAWTYTRNTSTLVSATSGYSWTTGTLNLEQANIDAGPANDNVNVDSLAAATGLGVAGGNGYDSLFLGQLISIGSWSTGSILGDIQFDAGAGGGRVQVYNNFGTGARTTHIDASSVSAFPGDNLFGAGSLRFSGLTDNGASFHGLEILFGRGSDDVFVQPSTHRVVLNGGAPGTAPGDTLNLALANAQNYVLNGTPASGSVTSDNLATLSYTAFESGPNVDDVAPAVVANDFQFNPGAPRGVAPMAFTATFTEDVSALLSGSFLDLFNTTTATPVPASDIAVAWDPGTLTATFTFPNYAGGLLPDGVYQARILGGLPDFFGNPAPDGPFYTFIWSAGSGADDTFRVALNPVTQDYEVYLNDPNTPAFLAGQGTAKIVLFGAAGSDSMQIDLSGGNPITPDGLSLVGGDDSDTLAVVGSAAADDVTFNGADLTANGSVAAHAQFESFTFDGGGGPSWDALTVNAGRVGIASTQYLLSLTIADDAGLDLPNAVGAATLVVQGLTLAPTARLDLAGGALVYDYTGASPIDDVRSLLVSGRNNGAWNGFGLNSSSAAANPAAAIGYAEATDLFTSFPAIFAGVDVDDSCVLVRYTLAGDANLDLSVNIADFARLAGNFNLPTGAWAKGDFNYDGSSGIADFSALASNFNQALPATGARFSSRQIATERMIALV